MTGPDTRQRVELVSVGGVEVDQRPAAGPRRCRAAATPPGRRRTADEDLLPVDQHPGQVERAQVDARAARRRLPQGVDDPGPGGEHGDAGSTDLAGDVDRDVAGAGTGRGDGAAGTATGCAAGDGGDQRPSGAATVGATVSASPRTTPPAGHRQRRRRPARPRPAAPGRAPAGRGRAGRRAPVPSQPPPAAAPGRVRAWRPAASTAGGAGSDRPSAHRVVDGPARRRSPGLLELPPSSSSRRGAASASPCDCRAMPRTVGSSRRRRKRRS